MTARRQAAGTRRIDVDASTLDVLGSIAEAMDAPLGPLVAAVLLGVARAGQVERFAEAGRAADPAVARRLDRGRARTAGRRWVADEDVTTRTGAGRPTPRGRSAVWRSGPWTLRYHGSPVAAGRRIAGDGWHLTGPSTDDPVYVAHVRSEAVEAADLLIDRWDALEAATAPLEATS